MLCCIGLMLWNYCRNLRRRAMPGEFVDISALALALDRAKRGSPTVAATQITRHHRVEPVGDAVEMGSAQQGPSLAHS